MSRQTINIGTAPNDNTGDPLRTAFQKTESNFVEVYSKLSTNIVVSENILIFDVVNGDGSKADSSVIGKRGKVVGIAQQNINLGFAGDIQHIGHITNNLWSFVQGDIIFLNGTILSTIPPTTGFIQKIGVAIAPNTIDINITNAILT